MEITISITTAIGVIYVVLCVMLFLGWLLAVIAPNTFRMLLKETGVQRLAKFFANLNTLIKKTEKALKK